MKTTYTFDNNNAEVNIDVKLPGLYELNRKMKPAKRAAEKIIKITAITISVILTIVMAVGLLQQPKNTGTVSVGLTNEDYSTNPSFLGMEFSQDLVDAINKKEINLNGVYLSHPWEKESKSVIQACEFTGTDDADKLCIEKAEWVDYSEEYIKKYFAPGYTSHNTGYWNYTIGLK